MLSTLILAMLVEYISKRDNRYFNKVNTFFEKVVILYYIFNG